MPIRSRAQWKYLAVHDPELLSKWQKEKPVVYADLPDKAESDTTEMGIPMEKKLSEDDIIPGGKADNLSLMVNSDQVKMGLKTEMEHTDDCFIALEIALDHLSEDPEYYTKLASVGLLNGKEESKKNIVGSLLEKVLSLIEDSSGIINYAKMIANNYSTGSPSDTYLMTKFAIDKLGLDKTKVDDRFSKATEEDFGDFKRVYFILTGDVLK